MPENKFPTEVVSLPSKGFFYPEDSPLAKGEVEIRYMTAKDEDILTSPNLIKKGIVIDKLLESLIVEEGVVYGDLLVGDKNAIMLAARILGYGADYTFDYECPNCSEKNVGLECNLSETEEREVDFSELEKGKNEFTYTLPKSKREITFKLLTLNDERAIEADLKGLRKVSKDVTKEVTTRLKRMILSVDGNSDRQFVNHFVDNEFFSIDSLEFRKHIQTLIPDVSVKHEFECELCTHQEAVTVPITVHFFWPKSRV